MYRHTRRGFLLVVVMALLSLAVVAETLATRHLMNLRRHVQQRRLVVQQRVVGSADLFKPATSQPAHIAPP